MWTIMNSMLLVIALSTTLTAEQVRVTYLSKPGFATIKEGNRVLGSTPLTLFYESPKNWKDCFLGRQVTVTWISGAETTLTPTVCPKTGNAQSYLLERPSGAPGAEIDVEYYKAAQEALYRRVAARVAKNANRQALRQSGNRNFDCTSRIVGGSVHTSCD